MSQSVIRHARGICVLLISSLAALPRCAAWDPGTALAIAPPEASGLQWPGPTAVPHPAVGTQWPHSGLEIPANFSAPLPTAEPTEGPLPWAPPPGPPLAATSPEEVFVPAAPTPVLPPGTTVTTVEPASHETWEPVAVDDRLPSTPPWDNASGEMKNPSRIMWVIGDADGLGWFGLESQGVLGYWGLAGFDADLGYSVYFLEGPRRSDLPPRLFGINYGVRWRDEVTAQWSYELAVAPGIYTDFEDSAREGLRIQGHGFAMWTLETVQFVLGIDYLDRETISLLPVAGMVWFPNDATRFDLVFPRPRVARRVHQLVDHEVWCYVRGEYGGDSWSIERDATGLVDVVTLNEIRVAFGLESVASNGSSTVFEVALHVDRELIYRSGAGSFHPADTVAFNWGSRY